MTSRAFPGAGSPNGKKIARNYPVLRPGLDSAKRTGRIRKPVMKTMGVFPLCSADRQYRYRVIISGLTLLGLTFLLYWPVQQFDFVAFDDTAYVTENRVVRKVLRAGGSAGPSLPSMWRTGTP